MTEESARALRYLSGSAVRPAILERLVDGPARPADLVERTGVSRTTVHRTLSEVTDRDWARRVDGGYDATPVGELALETYERARARFRTIDRFEPFLSHLGPAAADLDPDWLRGADLATATDANPYYPSEWYVERLAACSNENASRTGDEETSGIGKGDPERLRLAAPVFTRRVLAVHAPSTDEGPLDEGRATELVVGDAALRAVAERYPDQVRNALAHDGFDLYAASAAPSVGIALAGERVVLGAPEDGRLDAAVESADDRLLEWATHRYRRLRADARPVTEFDDCHLSST
ncbi:helix-turn-helix transcriptional regulator [Natrinema salifodinae]|uniref:Predicted transcriptional regulator, contains HTH domain n=2 Tax=Natrinema salifodinae TaxID=1202768 RepID=A0A1I0QDL0_9EURY|nr:hypothetical protein [Natrinema salifodinae]SEW25147.1 Predicted transcriptional regulator, contains HTH domain [Natrinema salifodinae]